MTAAPTTTIATFRTPAWVWWGAVYEKERFYLELFHIQPMLGLTELRCSWYISLSRPVVLEDLG